MDDLLAFLQARLDEFEAMALQLQAEHGTNRPFELGTWSDVDGGGVEHRSSGAVLTDRTGGEHVRRTFYTPAMLLADVKAKRQIVDVYAETVHMRDELAVKLEAVPLGERSALDLDRWQRAVYDATVLGGPVRLLALPYAGHPDYREEWKP